MVVGTVVSNETRGFGWKRLSLPFRKGENMKRLFVSLLLFILFSAPILADTLKLATTTSTDNSGLLRVLLPPFEKKYNTRVDVIAVGTGKAIKLGESKDVDVILVHARAAEDKFVQDGYGFNRRDVMYNDFVILGPASDPARIKSSKNPFKKIAAKKAIFVSRGDDSGTHKKEIELWRKAKISPKGKWYMSVGQGMGAALLIANEKQAYILCDIGTYLAYKKKMDLVLLSKADINPYGVIAINKKALPFIKWITSKQAKKIINNFKVSGEQLFYTQ